MNISWCLEIYTYILFLNFYIEPSIYRILLTSNAIIYAFISVSVIFVKMCIDRTESVKNTISRCSSIERNVKIYEGKFISYFTIAPDRL